MGQQVRVDYLSDGTRLSAWVSGVGTPLVWLHGSGLNDHSSSAAWAQPLSASAQVYACDTRGFGASVSRDPAQHSWDTYAADVVALLDHVGLPQAVVGGSSFGSGVAIGTALRHPDRVAGLVLADVAYPGTEAGRTLPQRAVWTAGTRAVVRARAEGLLAAVTPDDATAEERVRFRRAVERHDEQSFLAAHEGELATSHPFRSLADLRRVAAPALLLPGADDAHDPQITAWYAENLPVVTVGPEARADASVVVPAIKAFLAVCGTSRTSAIG